MAKIWLCRELDDLFDCYVLFVGRKPSRVTGKKRVYWKVKRELGVEYCSELFEDAMGRSLKLSPGAGPVEIEIFPRKTGKCLTAIEIFPRKTGKCLTAKASDLGFTVEIWKGESYLWDFDPDCWNKMAPRELRLSKRRPSVRFWARKAKK